MPEFSMILIYLHMQGVDSSLCDLFDQGILVLRSNFNLGTLQGWSLRSMWVLSLTAELLICFVSHFLILSLVPTRAWLYILWFVIINWWLYMSSFQTVKHIRGTMMRLTLSFWAQHLENLILCRQMYISEEAEMEKL